MKTKPKLIICGLIIFVGSILNLFFSTAVHQILSRQSNTLKLLSFGQCVGSIFSNKQNLMLFLCLQGFIIIVAIMFFLTNLRPYQSELMKVAPGIETPVPVGQHQHGSSRWLTDPEKDKAFESYVLSSSNTAVKELIKQGYDDLEFMKKGDEGNIGV